MPSRETILIERLLTPPLEESSGQPPTPKIQFLIYTFIILTNPITCQYFTVFLISRRLDIFQTRRVARIAHKVTLVILLFLPHYQIPSPHQSLARGRHLLLLPLLEHQFFFWISKVLGKC
jgi:hypothetical protein